MNQRERTALSTALARVDELERWNQRLAADLVATGRERDWALGQLDAIYEFAKKRSPHSSGIRYDDPDQREQARRRTWRESKRRQRAIGEAA